MSALAQEMRPVREAATQTVLSLDRLVRAFRQGPRRIEVLAGASADIYPGQAVALVGPSGAGKSTLLHIAGLLETPDGGRVIVNGRDCSGMGDHDRTRVRRGEIRAASSSAQRLRARSPTGPASSSQTSRPATSIRTRPSTSSMRSSISSITPGLPRSSPPTTWSWRGGWIAYCAWRTAS
jgi:energy-coupling factor transporter ATP-binding protein EcfA2